MMSSPDVDDLVDNPEYEDVLEDDTDNEIEMILADQPTQIFIGDKNISYRINVLKEFEKELEPKTISGFSYIDIRYDNQVIAKRRHS